MKSSLPFFLGLYVLLCGLFAVYLFLDTWSGRFTAASLVLSDTFVHSSEPAVKTLLYTIAGSILGGVIRSFRGLHIYAATRGEFKASFSGSYLIGPWAAAFLGLVMYAIIRGGLFVFGGVGTIAEPNEATELGYMGVGFFVGFAWDRTLEKLNSMALEFLASGNHAQESSSSSTIDPPKDPDAKHQAAPPRDYRED